MIKPEDGYSELVGRTPIHQDSLLADLVDDCSRGRIPERNSRFSHTGNLHRLNNSYAIEVGPIDIEEKAAHS